MEKESIVVSIYCKTYNHEKYIRNCLEGFVSQITNFRYEVIIHDDASTDNTPKIIEEYKEKYPDIFFPIFQNENQYRKRTPVFTKYMLPMMRGKYIACCEGDDYWIDSNKLQMQVDFLEKHLDYSACVHNTKVINMSNGLEFVNYQENNKDIFLEDVIKGGMSCYHTSSLMYRIQYAQNRPDFLRMQSGVGDYPLSIYLALEGKIFYFGKIMSVYRYGGNGSWTKKNESDFNLKIENYKKQILMLEAANEFSGKLKNDVFLNQIRRTQYEILVEKSEFFKILKDYKEFYYEGTFKHRVSIILKCFFPTLYKFLMKKNKFYV